MTGPTLCLVLHLLKSCQIGEECFFLPVEEWLPAVIELMKSKTVAVPTENEVPVLISVEQTVMYTRDH